MTGAGLITSMDIIEQLREFMQAQKQVFKTEDYLLAMQAAIMGYAQVVLDLDNTATAQNAVLITPTDSTPLLTRCIYRVEVAVHFSGSAPKLHKLTTRAGKKVDDTVLNAAAFVTGVAQSFDTQCRRGDLINFSFDQVCTIDYIRITEIMINS